MSNAARERVAAAMRDIGAPRLAPPEEPQASPTEPPGRMWSPMQAAVFEWIEKPLTPDAPRHLVIEALAGTGKSTTIEEATRRTLEGSFVLVCAFNKSIADAMRERLPADVDVMTLHSYGMRTLNVQGRRELTGISGKLDYVQGMAIELWGRSRDTKEARTALCRLVSLAKGCLTPFESPDAALEGGELDELADTYEIAPGDKGPSRAEWLHACRQVLRRCASATTGPINFDDMIWIPAYRKLPSLRYDWVFVDETQDLNAAQLALVQSAAKGGRVVAVGDRRQCHPAGTLVELTGGERRPIEAVRYGDKVVSYHDCFRGIAQQGRSVEAVGERTYTGDLLTLHAGGESVRVTPNHLIPTRMRPDCSLWALYLMEYGNTSRLGVCSLSYGHGKSKTSGSSCGPVARMRHERADRIWILRTFTDAEDAKICETVTALRFGLPEQIFCEKGRMKDRLIQAIGHNAPRARACLALFGRSYEHPLHERGDGKHIGRYLYITAACNLLAGVNELRSFDGTRDGGTWAPLQIDRGPVVNLPVYSLQVEPAEGGHRLYVADRLLVHNCIYGFRGADQQAIPRIIRELGAKVLPLSITYRCPRKVVAEANRIVPDLQAAPNAPEGVVREADEEALFEQAQPGDFVVSRTNAPLVSFCWRWLAAGRRAQMQGRDFAEGLIALIRQCAGNSDTAPVANVLRACGSWAAKEIARLVELERDTDSVSDRAACIEAIADGCTTAGAMILKAERLFAPVYGGPPPILCSSTHRAKGLEAERVWLLRDTYHPDRGHEESNLLYVAITRAKRELIYVHETPGEAAEKAAE